MMEGNGEAGWDDLSRELDAWKAEGWIATLWWRDDDAIDVTGALETMLKINKNTNTPLAMAVIPARAGKELRQRVAGHEGIHVLQHGFAHTNHEPEGQKKSEFGEGRDPVEAETELRLGHERLSGWARFLPVFVPPWNRIEDRFIAILPTVGLKGISCFKARQVRNPVAGVLSVNSHIDIIKSNAGRRQFIGVGPALQAITEHLSARRLGQVDRDEPSGLLTHHLDHREDAWTFIEKAFALIADHPAARWLSAAEVFNLETKQETS